jgi:hypothetical protein
MKTNKNVYVKKSLLGMLLNLIFRYELSRRIKLGMQNKRQKELLTLKHLQVGRAKL